MFPYYKIYFTRRKKMFYVQPWRYTFSMQAFFSGNSWKGEPDFTSSVQEMKLSQQTPTSNPAGLGRGHPELIKTLCSPLRQQHVAWESSHPSAALSITHATAEARFTALEATGQCYPICMKSKFSSFPVVKGQWVINPRIPGLMKESLKPSIKSLL